MSNVNDSLRQHRGRRHYAEQPAPVDPTDVDDGSPPFAAGQGRDLDSAEDRRAFLIAIGVVAAACGLAGALVGMALAGAL